MPKNNEIKFKEYFNIPNPGLRSYFDIVRRGQPEEYRTTFAKGSSVEDVLQAWSPFVEKLADKWPTLVEFEMDLKSKVGPMSIMKPLEQRMKDIEAYYTGISSPGSPLSESAIKAVISEFNPIRGLQVRDQRRTVQNMKLSTNSGNPYFSKRRLVVNKTLPVTVGQDDEYVRMNLSGHFWPGCAILGWRGQEGGPTYEDVKQRVVWMFPFGVNVCELQVYQPLIEAAQKFNLVPSWVSMESVDRRITQMFDTKGVDDDIICTDFSKFDQHFGSHLQMAAATIMTAIFTPT